MPLKSVKVYTGQDITGDKSPATADFAVNTDHIIFAQDSGRTSDPFIAINLVGGTNFHIAGKLSDLAAPADKPGK